MKQGKRFLWGAIVIAIAALAWALAVNLLYNPSPAARGLNRASLKVLVLGLIASRSRRCWLAAREAPTPDATEANRAATT
ncbi:MAG TPA: hypothetical protein VIN61_01595 [Gammaproteobacteria bacterium]